MLTAKRYYVPTRQRQPKSQRLLTIPALLNDDAITGILEQLQHDRGKISYLVAIYTAADGGLRILRNGIGEELTHCLLDRAAQLLLNARLA